MNIGLNYQGLFILFGEDNESSETRKGRKEGNYREWEEREKQKGNEKDR